MRRFNALHSQPTRHDKTRAKSLVKSLGSCLRRNDEYISIRQVFLVLLASCGQFLCPSCFPPLAII